MDALPPPLEPEQLRQWVGRAPRRMEDVAALTPARLMAATVDDTPRALQPGDALPPLWHWLYFLEGLPRAQLGPDGHPARGGFLPPVPLPNRMWAGGRVQWLAPLPLGAALVRLSSVQSVEVKQGRSGPLVFVTVLHALQADGQPCLREEHDIVFKGRSLPAAAATPELPAAVLREPWTPDSTQLFRYSALTFNGHRIHYDADYCRSVEGYDAPVVHGPLIATRLAGLAQRCLGAPLTRFEYRARQPVTLGHGLELVAAAQDGNGLALWAAIDEGAGVAMQARAWAAP
ncbi:FAS1-like dehydratase domain-containing protein [Ideonella alba]|nr:MaoC family dehydratase N-terminal domain-containing protein [Ideonella alba]